ncbi:uncharacterized protein H6S33_001369 [Morchella sextelata]|uniref:uncharacterized protein n=1 Tax=Morchella sextelata TaxID=1174677 RepID=UPI001D044830|nr:uncharacterized protein H6S33_001369 [Morchella sextelata]KAH0609141.1 hypothetical protein H6S33_001369 [Morchella sextelata]
MALRGRQPAVFRYNIIAEMRQVLQLTEKNALYRALHTDLEEEIIRLEWVSKLTSGEDSYNHLVTYPIDYRTIRALKPTFIRKASRNSQRIVAALNVLIVDQTQKSSRIHTV